MSEESSTRRRVEAREHARPGGGDPALKTAWAKPKYHHPGHRWHLAPERTRWAEGEQQRMPRLRSLLRQLFGRR